MIGWITAILFIVPLVCWLAVMCARIWRERPVVMYDEREQRWRAAPRNGRRW